MNLFNRRKNKDLQGVDAVLPNTDPSAMGSDSKEGAELLELLNLIKDRKLIVPALLMLELYRPLVGLADALFIFSEPFLKSFSLPSKLIDPLRSRANVDFLIKQLEQSSKCASVSRG